MPANPIKREFLGWERPALAECVSRLVAGFRSGRSLNLGNVIVVLPGRRAVRRLLELLAFAAEDQGLNLTPPEAVTDGQLLEYLYSAQFPFATDLTQWLTWAQALRELSAAELRHIVPQPPAAAETLRWIDLGKYFSSMHVELAAEGLDFIGVAKRVPAGDASGGSRWQALARLEDRYLALLARQQVTDIHAGRLRAIERREIRTDCDIILIGCADLNRSIRHALDQISDRVTAYIVAPQERAGDFDAHGCLVAERWCAADVPLRDDQLVQVEGPQEQAAAVTAWLAEFTPSPPLGRGGTGGFRRDEIAIGSPDESLVPQLQRQLEQCGVKARWIGGARLGESLPYQLLLAATQFGTHRRYDDVAALLRHPDLEAWLGDFAEQAPTRVCERAGSEHALATSFPAQLDRYYRRFLPSHMRSGRSLPVSPEWADLPAAMRRLDDWLVDTASERPLRAWGDIFRNLLGPIYGGRTLDLAQPADAALHRALKLIVEECDHLRAIPGEVDGTMLAAADAFQSSLGSLAQHWLPPPADPDALEILGWLDLALDDSRAVLVTSFNEGIVPRSTSAHLLLPEQLRREVGASANDRRYARDAYVVNVLYHARANLRVVFARRNADNDPLLPSRLLFACPDDVMIQRARRFFGARKPATVTLQPALLGGEALVPAEARFVVPSPVNGPRQVTEMPVTRFREYLACPYRYYLRYERGLQAVDDSARELDASGFGTLLHKVLGDLGRDPSGPRHSERSEDLTAYLTDRLSAVAKEMFGSDARRPALRLQLEQVRQRLDGFATRQSELVREGWRIVYAEDDGKDKLFWPFAVDGDVCQLVGRIDRVDFHESSRALRILDYKTYDRPATPEKKHEKCGKWIDLQLPLYRYLRQALHLEVSQESSLQLGYFNLPKELSATKVALAKWTGAALESADEEARRVIRGLRQGTFWPPSDPPPDYCEDLAPICLDQGHSPPTLDDLDGGQS